MNNEIKNVTCLDHVPNNSILGINYSGMHDSAVCIVSPAGEPVFALALERISRVKQDGRGLDNLLKFIPWRKINKIAVSTPELISNDIPQESKLLSIHLKNRRLASTLSHGEKFKKELDKLPYQKIYVGHQEAHAASAFWGSGFDEAICLTYDGGMSNDLWFGGLFFCSRKNGIESLDKFSALDYAKITTLYTFVTALLGFSPMQHEGKLTGLAAFGKVDQSFLNILKFWFEEDYTNIEASMSWVNIYSDGDIPKLIPSFSRFERYRAQIEGLPREDVAATIQFFTEIHVINIIEKAQELGWKSQNICLAGGLFANVKINQRIVESGFSNLFVAPAMTDDGTALGAALNVASMSPLFNPQPYKNMFLGPKSNPVESAKYLADKNIEFDKCDEPANRIADLLCDDKIIAIFQGRSEFGPRALGNRSILAQATDCNINERLNKLLNRTDFMPFAPMTRVEDAGECYKDIDRFSLAARFMTVTVNCTDEMTEMSPAVVHVDGTARPQLVDRENHPLVHAILTQYQLKSGNYSIVNTSFNVHEEPIVCSLEDAMRGFFESGLDYLYVEGAGLISYNKNQSSALEFLKEKNNRISQKEQIQKSIIKELDHRLNSLIDQGNELIERTEELVDTRSVLIERTTRLEEVSNELIERTEELVDTRSVLIERTTRLEEVSKELFNRTEELIKTRRDLEIRTVQLERVMQELDQRNK